MLIGYARTSTDDQIFGLQAQVETLAAAGCEEVRQEHASGVADRNGLNAVLSYLRKGDVLIVTTLSRLGRSTLKVAEIVAEIEKRGAGLRVLDMPALDTTTPTGKLLFAIMASLSEFEREQMLQRQAEGIKRAKAEGKFRGKQPVKAMKLAPVIKARHAAGEPLLRIAADLGVSRGLCYRALADSAPVPTRIASR